MYWAIFTLLIHCDGSCSGDGSGQCFSSFGDGTAPPTDFNGCSTEGASSAGLRISLGNLPILDKLCPQQPVMSPILSPSVANLVYIYMYKHIYTYYTLIRTCAGIHANIHKHTHTHTHPHAHTHTHTPTRTRTRTRTHAYLSILYIYILIVINT